MAIFSAFKKYREGEELSAGILSNASAFEFKEAYNSLVNNILHLQLGDSCKKIAVTSSAYGEGKSSLAINLALSLASNLIDKKILLVDADMRTPHIKAFLNSEIKEQGNAGLSDFLAGAKADDCFCNSHVGNLDVVYSGLENANPASLLNSEKMNEFISKCESMYDYVIIDTPPVSLVSDAVSLAVHVDGYLISAKSNFSTVPMISKAEDAVLSVGATVLGVVLA